MPGAGANNNEADASRQPQRQVRSRHPRTCAMRLAPFYYGWVVLASCCVLFLASIVGHTSGMSMVVPHLIEEFGLSRTGISFMWLCAMVTSAALLPAAGALVDAHGSRRVVHIAMVPYVRWSHCCLGLPPSCVHSTAS